MQFLRQFYEYDAAHKTILKPWLKNSYRKKKFKAVRMVLIHVQNIPNINIKNAVLKTVF